MTGVLTETGNLATEACIQGRQHEETEGEDSHLRAKVRGLE